MALFSSNFLYFCHKSSPKISSFFRKFTIVYRPFFYLKNDKKWAILVIFHFTLYWWFCYPHFSSKIKFILGYWQFFPSNFLVFCLKSSHKISSFFSNIKITLVYRPFFPSKMTRNRKFWPFFPFYPILMAF